MQESPQNVTLSKTLSWLLRHAATKEGLRISPEGFIPVNDILNHKKLKGHYTVDDINNVVKNNTKQRFLLTTVNGTLQIRANQGHSQNVAPALQLDEIMLTCKLHFDVIHGTYLKCWNKIKQEGLSRMTRSHIHFASGLPNDKEVVSGIRQTCNVFIYIDLPLALSEGIKFYRSLNNVILSAGNSEGFIKPKYFLKVCKSDGSLLKWE